MGKQIEALKDHTDLRAFSTHLRVAELVQLVALLTIADQLAVDR